MSPMTTGESAFVNREEETGYIKEVLERAKKGEGKLLLVRGEAGSGKTRLLQEAVNEAKKLGFDIGFGTSLAESVTTYHPWKEVLEGLGLAHILYEAPPPKLMGLYLFTPEGRIQAKAERKDIDSDLLSNLASLLAESVLDSKSQYGSAEGRVTALSKDGNRFLLQHGSGFHLGAVVEGQEDEAFLADMNELGDEAESMFSDEEIQHKEEGAHEAIEAHMQQLLDSEIYEGIDYAREDPKLRQNKLFEHVTLGISRKAGIHPVCVIIDDLHWADPSSLALLHYISRNTRKMGVLFLCTYRIEEVATRPHLKDALKGMEQEDVATETDLRGLSRGDLAELAESFIGSHSLSDAFLDLLWRETRGFPLFVREVLFGLEDDGEIVSRGVVKRLVCPLDEVSLPQRVRDVIRARLDQLPRKDRQLLDAAATCGTRFTAALVSRVAGEEERNVLNGLSAIARVYGLLRPVNSGFTFNHPAVQEVVYENVPTEERRAYHREAAEWLEIAGGPTEDIGEHYYRARDSRAVSRLQEAAIVASAKYANDEAGRLLEEALELASPEQRGELLELRGDALMASANYEESKESYESALEFGEDKYRIAGIRGKIAKVCERRGDYEGIMIQCTQALNLVRWEGTREEADALLHIGNAHHFQGNLDKGFEYFTKSLEIWENLDESQGISNVLNDIGNIHADRGDYEKALDCYEKRLAISGDINDLRGVGGAFNNIGTVYRDLGDYEKALDYFGRSIDTCERIGERHTISLSLANSGEIHFRLGDYESSYEQTLKSLDISEKIGDNDLVGAALNAIGNLYAVQDDWNEALDVYRRSLEQRKGSGYVWNVASVLNNIGTAHLELGDNEKALEFFNKGLSLSEKMGERTLLAELYYGIAGVHLAQGDLQKALRFCDMAFTLSTETNQKPHIGASRRVLGMIYRERRLWKESEENFEDGIQVCREIGDKFGEGLLHYEFGQMWRRKGDVGEAKEHHVKAAELFEELKLPKRAAKAQEALAALNAEA